MKKALIFVAFFYLFCESNAQIMWQFNKDTVVTWYYNGGDEFNGNNVNRTYWNYLGWSRSLYMNKEQQYYTEGKNHDVNNGTLKLIAKKDSVFAKTVDSMNDNDSLFVNKKFYSANKKYYTFTSGKLISMNTYNKGFFECRFKIPESDGYWPAFWMYGGDPYEEIDLMECKTERPTQIHIDTHCKNTCDMVELFLQKKSYGGWVKTKYNFVTGYNIVACNWSEDEIRFYLNGEGVGISKVNFDKDKHIIINLAIPSDDGPFHPGPGKKDSVAVFEVDYVRIWNKKETKNPSSDSEQIFTDIDTVKSLIVDSRIKTKSKITYGKKSDHANEGPFISCFDGEGLIQIYVLGSFKNEKPKYYVISHKGSQELSGEIENQIFSIDKTTLQKGVYDLVIQWGGKSVKKVFATSK